MATTLLTFPFLSCLLMLVEGQQCTNGFTELTPSNASVRGFRNFTTVRVIPGMKFTCNGKIVWLKIGGLRRIARGSQYPKLQIWRNQRLTRDLHYSDLKMRSEILLNPSRFVCRSGDRLMSWKRVPNSNMYQCSLGKQVYVPFQRGDTIGIELPSWRDNKFRIYFNTSANGPLNYIYAPGNDQWRYKENARPQIMLRVQTNTIPTSNNGMSNTRLTDSTGPASPSTNQAAITEGIATATGIAIVLLMLTIISLMVVCVLQLNRKRNIFPRSSDKNAADNNSYPNPLYYNNQIHVASIQGGTENPTADYEEIKDEMCTERSSLEKLQLEADCKSLELIKSSNHYFTLTEQPPPAPEEHESISNSVNQAANYEVYIPSNDTRETLLAGNLQSCAKTHECSKGQIESDDDGDSTYWEPADSINELYKQLSSKKYREIVPTNVKLTGVLGSGEFGTVNQGVWESPMGAMDVAVKQLQPGASEEEKVKFLQEAAINGQFRHPNVVKLMGVVTTGEPTMIVLELLSRGDLRTFLKQQQPHESQNLSADQQILLKFCQQVASGMEYLSKKGFVHRDLAARNILVSGDHICKISDFGMSRNLMDENYYISHGGKIPVKWTAPEAIHYRKYSSASDVWSFGCVIYEIWSLGHKPYESYTNPEVIKMVDKGHRLPPPPGLTKELYKIMIQCWQPESSRRPTFSQLVEILSRADFELFTWEEEDLKEFDQRVKVIGAPLELAQNLYTNLQNAYK